jgi:hypothetical protein
VSMVVGAGVAVAFVVVFWMFLSFIEDMQRHARRH